jgi:hypothetical protein
LLWLFVEDFKLLNASSLRNSLALCSVKTSSPKIAVIFFETGAFSVPEFESKDLSALSLKD